MNLKTRRVRFVVGSAADYAELAVLAFNLGLRRYASGNRFVEVSLSRACRCLPPGLN